MEKVKTMENQIVHKIDNENLSEMDQSAKSSTSRCQAVECKGGVLLMVGTEFLQTCPRLSGSFQGKIISLRPSHPAQALFND